MNATAPNPLLDFSGLPLVIEAADLLPRLDSPQLILVDLSSANRYVSGHIPGARFVEIEGAGHLPCVEAPAAHAALVSEFLKETKDV